tara:strand:+ start:134 stop:1318 length:1185 start_codon:yes stop_codon:yes gene_type:complete
MLDNITVIIFTYKRYPYLRRLLRFYNSYHLQCKFLVLDSTPDHPKDLELQELLSMDNVQWERYDPDIFFVDKIANGCNFVNSKYAVLCADDDFIIPEAISDCISFLENNMDFSSTHGLYFNHSSHQQAKRSRFSIGPLYHKGRSASEKTAGERVNAYLSGQTSYYPFYAVQKTATFHTIWRETEKFVSDWGFSELFPCSLSLILGKMKVLPIFYASREPNTFEWHNEGRHRSMYTAEKIEQAAAGLAKHLSETDDLLFEDAERFVQEAIETYLSRKTKKSEMMGEKSKSTGEKSIFLNSEKNDNEKKESNDFIINDHSFVIKLKHFLRPRTRLNLLVEKFMKIQNKDIPIGCHPSIYPKYKDDFQKVKTAVLSAALTSKDLNEARRDFETQGKV